MHFSISDLPDSLAKHIHPCPNSGCWIWAGGKSGRAGEYGRAYYEGRHMQAHIAVLKAFGIELEPGHVPDHDCVTPCCVYPGHLVGMTHRENIRKSRGPAGQNARATACVNGHAFEGENYRTRKDGSRVCRLCHNARSAESKRRARAAKMITCEAVGD